MYNHILELLNPTNKNQVITKLKTDDDPLKHIIYVNLIENELTKKSSQQHKNK